MMLLNNFEIPEEYKNEINSLDVNTLQLILKELVKVITCPYQYTFNGPDTISNEFDIWIRYLKVKDCIKLCSFILYLIDNQTNE